MVRRLRDLYGEIVIPPAVAGELTRNGVEPDPSWTRVIRTRSHKQLAALLEDLDPGEAEAILITSELSADLLLVDETRGRRIAISRGLKVTGLLGVPAEAKERRLIPLCGPVLNEMISVAGFWVGDNLLMRFLRGVGELD